jgi:intracellular septation protein A
MLFLSLALVGAAYLVTDLLFHATAAALVTAAVAIMFAWFWGGLPLTRKLRNQSSS